MDFCSIAKKKKQASSGMHFPCQSPWEAVCSSQNKIGGDQDSSADVGTSEVERQLPGPLTDLGHAAPNDPGCRLLPTTVWEQRAT